MSYADQVYIETCKKILNEGVGDYGLPVRPHWEDGTPAHTVKLFGVVNRYDLRKEFPLMTLRRTYWKSAIDELLWIWQKKSNRVCDLGSHVWDSWANEEGTIGKAYGYQLAKMYKVSGVDIERAKALFGAESVSTATAVDPDDPYMWHDRHLVITKDGLYMDQVDKVLYDLKYSPQSRRILTSTYNHQDLTEMGLSPCAYSMTFNVSGNVLNAILNQRSQDMLTANNWNVVQYAALVMMFAQVSGLVPGELVHVIADCHIYDRHIPMVQEMIEREQYPAPKVTLDPSVTDFYAFTKNSFSVENYQWNTFDSVIPVAV